MDAKVLFYGTPQSTQETVIAVVPTQRKWIVAKIYLTNTGEEPATITLKHYINSTNTVTLLSNCSIDANKTYELSSIVIEENQKILAKQNTDSAIELIAYGYEETM